MQMSISTHSGNMQSYDSDNRGITSTIPTKELVVQMATAVFASVPLCFRGGAVIPFILQKLSRPLHFQIAPTFIFQICKIVKMDKNCTKALLGIKRRYATVVYLRLVRVLTGQSCFCRPITHMIRVQRSSIAAALWN